MEKGEQDWSERKLQGWCFQWHWNTFSQYRGLLFQVNNNATDEVKGNIQKAIGRVPGVSDLIYLYNGRAYCIEMKEPGKGRQSKAQKEWSWLVKTHNFEYIVVDSTDMFKATIEYIHSDNKK